MLLPPSIILQRLGSGPCAGCSGGHSEFTVTDGALEGVSDMARRKTRGSARAVDVADSAGLPPACGIDRLLAAAVERSDESLETGRYIVTFREGVGATAGRTLQSRGLRVADTRDFAGQAVDMEDVGDADALVFGEIGCAVVGADSVGAASASTRMLEGGEPDDAVEAIEPEYFAFDDSREFLRGFLSAANAIGRGIDRDDDDIESDVGSEALGATWGLAACRVPASPRSGANIRVAILDTGLDLKHRDFAGRPITSKSFVGQPVQDGSGHGTHVTGTALGPKAPPGSTPRYGVAFAGRIFIGKVLNNSGSGTTATVLAGMNWAIACKCHVINLSLGAQTPPQAAYTAAGNAALSKGLLMIAAAGNRGGKPTGAPANSPSIFAVGSVNKSGAPSSFSSQGKIEIAAPGRDVFSAWPRPQLYRTISGTSMAAPHVAGCAALWAQTSGSLRGGALWNRLRASAKRLPHPSSRVGAGLVQAP